MLPKMLKSWLPVSKKSARRPVRLGVEYLEERLAPAAGLPQDIVVGRTLSAYTVDRVQNNRLDVTYTVYNQTAGDVTGVLLTSTLQSGVSFASATVLPDRSGQELAWSLGTLPAFGRASVTLTVAFPTSIPLQIDSGARAFGTQNAGAVTDDAPAAALVNRVIPADQLASTPDANTTDPFVQEQAAKLDYDPQRIFDYLNTEVGYESYTGSLRGARGTLWSAAGNSLDEASLGVALFRASGIPARYAQGTLSDPLSKQLILSMFPNGDQAIGFLPAGAAVSDPANDPKLLAETRTHYWVQFDSTGTGFVNADTSGLPGGGIGTAFTTASNTFTEVADGLRHKVEVKLNAETYSQIAAAFGLGGGLGVTTVLDQTFNAVDLVGRSLTFGNYVGSRVIPGILSSISYTYTPYVLVGDDATDPANLNAVTGTSYQEVLTNFPLGTSVLTGLDLETTLTGPDGPAETFTRTLLDRIGFAQRRGIGTVNFSAGFNTPPALAATDVYTLTALPGVQNQRVLPRLEEFAAAGVRDSQAAAALSPSSPGVLAGYVRAAVALSRLNAVAFHLGSATTTKIYAETDKVRAYFDRPRLTITSTRLVTDPATNTGQLVIAIDLRRDFQRVLAAPGQNLTAVPTYRVGYGYIEGALEAELVRGAGNPTVSTHEVFNAAAAQGIATLTLTPGQINQLDGLPLAVEAKLRIADALRAGKTVVVPAEAVALNGTTTSAWYEIDPVTGENTPVTQDGGHSAFVYFGLLTLVGTLAVATIVGAIGAPGISAAVIELRAKDCLKKPDKLAALVCLQNIERDLTRRNYPGNDLVNVLSKAFALIILESYKGLVYTFGKGSDKTGDPPAGELLYDVGPPPVELGRQAAASVTAAGGLTAGAVSGSVQTPGVRVSGQIAGSWTAAGTTIFRAGTLTAAGATVTDANGNSVGTGAVGLATGAVVELTAGTGVNISGSGELAFYAPAGSGLGVSGDWANYTATLSGSPALRLTTDGLVLNGSRLPAGTYSITAASAALTGSGPTSAPEFTGAASLTATGAAVNLGPAAGNLRVGGGAVDATNGLTLTGYTGSIAVTSGATTDAVVFQGAAANVLALAATPAAATGDQNAPVTLTPAVRTSLPGGYTLTAEVPTGWRVVIDAQGQVFVTVAPGLQSGTFSVRLVARSNANPALVAQAVVPVTVTPTAAGVRLAVEYDPSTTVPAAGSQSPTSFRATIQNTGPTGDTINLTFPNPPAGFVVRASESQIPVPAGHAAIIGMYLVPNGGALPAPGTVIAFDVTATSATNPAITQTRTVTFTMPEVRGVTVTATPSAVATTPGNPTTTTLTLTAVGNVADSVTLTATLPSGLSATGLPAGPITLNPGQSTTITVGLTPAAATPLNSTLAATFTATFAPGELGTQTLQVPVRVVVPGADAIAGAANAAAQLGNADLANRLNDLATAMTNLFQTPDSAVFKDQTLASLDAIGRLIAADPFLTTLIGPPDSARQTLAGATTPAEVRDGITQIGNYLSSLNGTLTDIAERGFTLTLGSNTATLLPGVPAPFQVLIQNTGSRVTTYDLTVGSPSLGVTGRFVRNGTTITSVTLQPGEAVVGGPNVITLELTATGNELFATAFDATATAREASQLRRTVQGSLTVRREFVQVTAVNTTPPFITAGGPVAVSARLLNAVNRQQTASVSFVVKDPAGAVIFTSNPTAVTLTVQTSLQTVNLGNFDTTGFANGDYAIEVTVRDGSNAVLPGGTGNGRLQIGLPVTATLTAGPATLATGNGTVTNTLSLTTNTTLTPPFRLVGQVATTLTSSTLVIRGTTAYVAGSNGVDIVDVSNPTAPVKLSTFAQDLIVRGGYTVVRELPGDRLVVASTISLNATGTTVLVYSVTDPLNPVLLFNKQIQEAFMTDFLVSGSTALLTTQGVFLYGNNSTGSAFDQFGDVTALNLDAAGGPAVADRLFGTRNPPFTGDTGQSGGEIIDANTAYITSTTLSGNNFTNGVGRLLVVNFADPANLVLTKEVQIPGTVSLSEVAVDGNTALVVGSSRGSQNPWNNTDTDPTNDSGNFGNLTLTTLDITDRNNPVVVSTVVTSAVFPRGDQPSSKLSVVPVGGGRFAISLGIVGGNPVIFLVDASNPQTILTSALRVNAVVSEMAVNGGKLYTTSADGLLIYDIGQVDTVPVAASVTVPKNTGVAVVANSFNIPPTRIITGPDFDTLVFDRRLAFGLAAETITWQTAVTDLKPGELRAVTGGTSLTFTVQGTPGTVTLPKTAVAAANIIALTPPTRTAAPGSPAAYTVTLSNPTDTALTLSLNVQGVPADWVTLAPGVTVAAGGSATATLTLTPSVYADLADYGFVVTAVDSANSAGARGSAEASLTVAGAPPAVDSQAHGVVVQLTPATATAGQGTTAVYTVRVTNTGSTTETFNLSAAGLPVGVVAQFSQTSVTVPPGAGNFRELQLGLTPEIGTAAGNLPFTVSAASTSSTDSAAGTLVVAASGVSVSLNRATGSPGDTFLATVTNTGTAADTFGLSAAGPGGLVTTLGSAKLTLAPGESRDVPVTTAAAGFAAQGKLNLLVAAQSETDAAVRDSASAGLQVAPSVGLTAGLTPTTQTLPAPGATAFTVVVNNTGNTEDAYTATITGTTGGLAANLVGLDGLPAQTVPIFRIPGLSSGALLLNATAAGPGTVTVTIASLNDPTRTATVTATVGIAAPVSPPPASPPPVSPPATAPAPTPTAPRGHGQIYAVGAGPGGGPRVQVYDALTNQKRFDFFAYDSTLRGGVSVATGDVTGDGIEDIITGAGNGGGPHVKVFDGATGALAASFFAYDSTWRGGVWVATGDIDGDGVDEIVTGAGVGGGPAVGVWRVSGSGAVLTESFFAFDPSLRTGVTVAVGVGPDGRPVIAAGVGPGGPPQVRTFDARTHAVRADLFAFEPQATGGVYVAAGNVLGTARGTQFLLGPGPGGGPRLRVIGADGEGVADTFAAQDTRRNGLTVAALEKPTGAAAVLVGAGLGAYRGDLAGGALGTVERVGFFEDAFDGGVFVG